MKYLLVYGARHDIFHVLPASMFMHMCPQSLEEGSEPLELELQMVVSYSVCSEPGSSLITTSALDC